MAEPLDQSKLAQSYDAAYKQDGGALAKILDEVQICSREQYLSALVDQSRNWYSSSQLVNSASQTEAGRHDTLSWSYYDGVLKGQPIYELDVPKSCK